MKRVISTELKKEEASVEATLRPKTLDEYIGQENVKRKSKGLY